MFCRKCGTEILEGANACTNCGELVTPVSPATPVQVESHIVGAILVTLFCCLPLGIVSIINASRVSSLLATGNIGAAKVASDKAAKFMWWAFGLGIVAQLFGVALHVVVELMTEGV